VIGLVALALGVAACTQAPALDVAPKTGAQVLSEAVAKTKNQPYSFTMAYGTFANATGRTNGTGSATTLSASVSDAASGVKISLQGIILASGATPAVYVRADLGVIGMLVPGFDPNKWMHIDPSKAPGAERLGIKPGVDTFGPAAYLGGVLTADVVSSTEIKGTLDVTKTTPLAVAPSQLEALSADARKAPFTATLDAQGRVSKLVIKMPALTGFAAADLTLTYTEWGVTPNSAPVAPPADQIVEAPQMIYEFLG
jgi:hypothetical protein